MIHKIGKDRGIIKKVFVNRQESGIIEIRLVNLSGFAIYHYSLLLVSASLAISHWIN